MAKPTLAELAAWADQLEPAFHGETPSGQICLLAWDGGWAVGVGEDALAVARANALAIGLQGAGNA